MASSPSPSTSLAEEEAVPARPIAKSQAYLTTATFAAAGTGNALSACCTNPFDVVKVRQQLAYDRARASFPAVAMAMVRNEGPLSLWSGVTASCLRELSYSTIRMGGYEPIKHFYDTTIGLGNGFGTKLLAGISSGAIGAACSTPTDLMKVRMQAPRPASGKPPYRNTFVGFAEVYRQGGLQALWRGTYPNVIRAAILTSSQIASYDQVKGLLRDETHGLGMKEGLKLHFSASMIAGFICSAASQPVDTIKVRVMTVAKNSSSSAFSLLRELLKNEGPMGLYKGFGACWLRLGSHTVISLVLFETLRGALGIKPL